MKRAAAPLAFLKIPDGLSGLGGGSRKPDEETIMSEVKTYPVSTNASQRAWIDESKYFEMYEKSIKNPDAFWGEQSRRRQEDHLS